MMVRKLILPAMVSFSFFVTSLTGSAASVTFSEYPTDEPIPGGFVAWGDYDQDGDLDLVTGCSTIPGYAHIIQNEPTGEFNEVQTLPCGGGMHGRSNPWSDFDGDGDLDLALPGRGSSYMYENAGGTFTEDSRTALPVQSTGGPWFQWGDIDRVNGPDLVIIGVNSSGLFLNDGTGKLTKAQSLPTRDNHSGDLGDFDGDGFTDLVLIGKTPGGPGPWHFEIYQNDGGSFSLDQTFPGAAGGGTHWVDYNLDGLLDIFVIGQDSSAGRVELWKQDLAGNFNLDTSQTALSDLEALGTLADNRGQAAWGDYDNDGDADLIVSTRVSGGCTTKTFLNEPTGMMVEDPGTGLHDVSICYWYPGLGDFDADGDVDLAVYQDGSDTKIFSSNLSPPIFISHIEVNQVVQTELNDLPLIAGKPTFVRVYLGCSSACPAGSMNGTLMAIGPEGAALGTMASTNRVTVTQEYWPDQRDDLAKTLNFTLPSNWITGTVTLYAAVQDAAATHTVNFLPAKPISVLYKPIKYKGQLPDLPRISAGSWFASTVFPTDNVEYLQGTTLDWDLCLEKFGLDCLIPWINAVRLENELKTHSRFGDEYVFGWLPDGSYFAGGRVDSIGGTAGWGVDYPTEGPRVFAHEIGHLLDRRHANTNTCKPNNIDPDSDWPYTTSRTDHFGIDGSSPEWTDSSNEALKNPASTWDYMSYCGSLTNGSVWTSAWNYNMLYVDHFLQTDLTPGDEAAAPLQDHIIASGLVYTDDLAILDPIITVESSAPTFNPEPGTQYCIEARDASEVSLSSHCFDLDFIDLSSGDPVEAAGFNIMLPKPANIARVVLTKGDAELASRDASGSPPSVTVISPNGGEIWETSGTYTVTWTASDADDDPLFFRVLYSPDGSTWQTLGTMTTDYEMPVDASELAGSTGAMMRVIVSDGFYDTKDESDSAFTVGRKTPSALIISPEDGSFWIAGSPVVFQGYAYDLEDGVLADSALTWSSDLDGSLGTGNLVITQLSTGSHRITFSAQDSDGNSSSASTEIFIGYRNFLPITKHDR